MSNFDAIVADLDTAIFAAFGDVALITKLGREYRLSTVVESAEGEVGYEGRAIDPRLFLNMRQTDLPSRPLNGESVTIAGGLWAGNYLIDQVVGEDGALWRVAIVHA